MPIEQLEAASGKPNWLLAATRTAFRFLPGQELTPSEFNAALNATAGSVI